MIEGIAGAIGGVVGLVEFCKSWFRAGKNRKALDRELRAMLAGKPMPPDIESIINEAERNCGSQDETVRTMKRIVSDATSHGSYRSTYGGSRTRGKKAAKRAAKKTAKRSAKKFLHGPVRKTAKNSMTRATAKKAAKGASGRFVVKR